MLYFYFLWDFLVSCKFVQTDIIGDELVQLQLLKTLQCIVYSIGDYIKQEITWDILYFFFTVLETTGMPNHHHIRFIYL